MKFFFTVVVTIGISMSVSGQVLSHKSRCPEADAAETDLFNRILRKCNIIELYLLRDTMNGFPKINDYYDHKTDTLKKVFDFDKYTELYNIDRNTLRSVLAKYMNMRQTIGWLDDNGHKDGLRTWMKFVIPLTDEMIPNFPGAKKGDEIIYFPTSITDSRAEGAEFCKPAQKLFFKYLLPKGSSPAWNYTNVLCHGGCLTADELIMTTIGYMKIGELHEKSLMDPGNMPRILSLDGSSSLNELKYRPLSITTMASDDKPVEQDMVKVILETGNTLDMSANHPLLTNAGKVVYAKSVKAGDQLMSVNSMPVRIVNIHKSRRVTKVFNIATTSKLPHNHFYVAQGLLSGDLWLQDNEQKWSGQILLRHQGIPSEFD